MKSSHKPEGWLDKSTLFQHVRRHGLRIDDSILEEFQKQGLMLPPTRVSQGRHGNPGYWSPRQAELLRCLCLATQQKGARSVASRCNLPLWVWIYWGDEYGVTLEQVQRVMRTWALRMNSGTSLKQARTSAVELVTQAGNAPRGGLQRARKELAECLSTGNSDPAMHQGALAHVFDPRQRPNGPKDIPITPDTLAFYLQATRRGIEVLVSEEQLAPGLWLWGRHVLLIGLHEYAIQQPAYAREVAGTPVEKFFDEETIATLVPSVCAKLSALLGAALLPPVSANYLPDHLRPDFWVQRVKAAHVHAELIVSPLWIPSGGFLRALTIQEDVTLS